MPPEVLPGLTRDMAIAETKRALVDAYGEERAAHIVNVLVSELRDATERMDRARAVLTKAVDDGRIDIAGVARSPGELLGAVFGSALVRHFTSRR